MKKYLNFMNEIKNTDLEAVAKILDLEYSESESILIPFLSRTYNVSQKGIYRDDRVDRSALHPIGAISVL
ncbi:hypothetical protein SAMN04487931_10982 [Desulfobacula phenolica]|uniref:Uncharacterized protein n=1 Tax=Desulfobacula phenolica TaxID=90732 RepID=A0A1H2IQ85_9BACT|nr:hypothetical protein SAMN04487931_10982 [Desulfobacula phenolica]